MNTEVYQSRVGLPNPVTDVAGPMVQADNQVANALGGAAAALGNMSMQYIHAKHVSDTNAANVEIKTRVNDFMQQQRRMPAARQGNETLLQAREREWDEFSADLEANYLPNIENGQVSENLTKEWESRTEDYKNQVMNAAIDEDIVYMHEVAGDSINKGMALAFEGSDPKAFAQVKRDTMAEEQAGNISQAEREHYWNQVDKTEALWETKNGIFNPETGESSDPMNYAEAQLHIENAGLEADEKTEALAYLKTQEEIRIKKAISDGMISHQTSIHDGAYDGMSSNAAHDLLQERMVVNNPDFSPQNQETEHAVLARRIAKNAKGGDEDPSDPKALRAVFDAIRDYGVSSEEARQIFLDNQGDLSISDIRMLDGLIEKDMYSKERAMDTYADEAVTRIEGFFKGDEERAAAAGNMILNEYNYRKSNASGDDLYKETFITREEIDNMVRAQMNDQMLKLIDEDTLEETNGKEHLTDFEIFIREGEEGNIASLTERELTAVFYTRPDLTVDQMKDMYVERMGKTKWKDLSQTEQNQATYSINAAKLATQGSGFIRDVSGYMVHDVVLDDETSMPIFNTIVGHDGEGNAIISQLKLVYDEHKNEERIMIFNPDPKVRDWEALNGTYRDTSADVGVIAALKATADAVLKLNDGSAAFETPTPEQNEDITVEGEQPSPYTEELPEESPYVQTVQPPGYDYKDSWLGD